MNTVHMGINQTPQFQLPSGYEGLSDSRQEYWRLQVETSLGLRNKIIEAISEHGDCSLNWLCNGATRFDMHAREWEEAMSEYAFEIGRYSCKVSLREIIEGEEETCDICDIPIAYGFSLCNHCSTNQLNWDEDLDAHIMKNGDVYKFCSVVGEYELQERKVWVEMNKCTFCGDSQESETKVVGGYTILDTCQDCETDILGGVTS